MVALDYDSIELTFSDEVAVCGSPETECAALTANHFEVVHYEGDISSIEAPELPTLLTIRLRHFDWRLVPMVARGQS